MLSPTYWLYPTAEQCSFVGRCCRMQSSVVCYESNRHNFLIIHCTESAYPLSVDKYQAYLAQYDFYLTSKRILRFAGPRLPCNCATNRYDTVHEMYLIWHYMTLADEGRMKKSRTQWGILSVMKNQPRYQMLLYLADNIRGDGSDIRWFAYCDVATSSPPGSGCYSWNHVPENIITNNTARGAQKLSHIKEYQRTVPFSEWPINYQYMILLDS